MKNGFHCCYFHELEQLIIKQSWSELCVAGLPWWLSGKQTTCQCRWLLTTVGSSQSLGGKDSLLQGMATHSSILAWEVPKTEEPGGLPSKGLQRVRHKLTTERLHTQTHTHTHTSSLKSDIKKQSLVHWSNVVHCFQAMFQNKFLINFKKFNLRDFPGGAMDKNPPANTGDIGSIPGPGRFHMLGSN